MSDGELVAMARSALDDVLLPDGTALSTSPRLNGPTLNGGSLRIAISIQSAEVAQFARVRDDAEAALRALPRGEDAMVVLTGERAPAAAPPHRSSPSPDVAPPARPEPLAGVAHVVAVASGKGGVGKSTTSVNLALGLRALGLKVGTLDADIHGPSLPTLLALHGRPRVGADRRLLPMHAHGLKAMSMGLMVDPETAMIWRGPMVMSAITQMINDVDWGELDILVVDMPPGTGDAQLAIAQGTTLSGAVIVSTPQDLALVDARRGITMFRKVDVPILGIIENMAHFLCPDCGGRHAIFGEGGAAAEARRLGVPYLGAVPLSMELRGASDAGWPIAARDPEGALGRLYGGMASTVWSTLKALKNPHKRETLKGT